MTSATKALLKKTIARVVRLENYLTSAAAHEVAEVKRHIAEAKELVNIIHKNNG